MENPTPASNTQKYYNYIEQMVRLKKAMAAQFYLEAIFIEYAVMEDRLASVLIHSGRKCGEREGIASKIKKVAALGTEESSLAHRYFPSDYMATLVDWKRQRDTIIHNLMNQKLATKDLQKIALEGQQIVKRLNSKATNYRKALERQAAKAQKQEG